MKPTVFLGMTTAALAVLSGCSNITMLRIAELKQVEARVDSLKNEMIILQKQSLEQQKLQGEIIRSIRADQSTRFSELERNLSSLVGSITESQDQLSRIDQKTQAIKSRWDEKVHADSTSAASKNNEAENLFSVAQQDFAAGRNAAALAGFSDIAGKYPQSPQAEQASYWIAECYYTQKEWEKAETAYKNYFKSYGTGSKVCSALYKLGLIYENTKKKKSQDMVWDKLVGQCPDSEEAQAVKARRAGE
jgi:TolA-binding protein